MRCLSMVRPEALVLSVVVAACAAPRSGPQPPESPEVLTATDPVVAVQRGAREERTNWRLSAELDPDILAVQVPEGQKREVCFFSGENTLCRAVATGEQYDFVIRYDGTDYPTRIQGVPPAAVFDEAYREANRGEVTVVVPEVYEMVNVAIALTPWAQRENNWAVWKRGHYYEDLREHFARVERHPLVRWLDAELRDGYYARHKMNAIAFVFDSAGRIRRSPVYNRHNWPGPPANSLLPVLEQMQSFADASDFQDFYRDHRELYDEQEAFFREKIDVEGMLEWLSDNFPAVEFYDHVKVVFSPLVWASQSVTWYPYEGFSEIQPHMNFPYPVNIPGYENLDERSHLLQRSGTLFTELNHGFINPTAEGHRDEIARAMGDDRDYWVRPESSASTYGWPEQVFLEMMNHGLLSLYFVDRARPEDHEALVSSNARHQADGRGFLRAPEFHDFLVDLYRSRPDGTTVAELYPEIIAWFDARGEG